MFFIQAIALGTFDAKGFPLFIQSKTSFQNMIWTNHSHESVCIYLRYLISTEANEANLHKIDTHKALWPVTSGAEGFLPLSNVKHLSKQIPLRFTNHSHESFHIYLRHCNSVEDQESVSNTAQCDLLNIHRKSKYLETLEKNICFRPHRH